MMLLTKIEPEAFFTVSEQTELFLLSVLAGVTFGVLWDVFRALRVMLPPMRSTALTAVCDALYMIICGLGLYIFSLLFARGEIRAFYWLGALLGAVIYILTAGTVIMGFLRWLFGGIYGFLHKVYLFAAKPFVFFRQKMLTKMNSKFVSNAKKIRAKSKNYKKHLKNIPEMLYNKYKAFIKTNYISASYDLESGK